MTIRRKKANTVQWKGVVESQSEARSLLNHPGDTVLVKRGRPRALVMRCPDGCGDELVVNLDARVGPAWRLYETRKGPTLYPSVWRESGCESHFIVWNRKIYWCDYDTLWDDTAAESLLDDRAIGVLSDGRWYHYEQVAEAIDEVPWTALLVCRRLSKRGVVEEGTEKLRGSFKLAVRHKPYR